MSGRYEKEKGVNVQVLLRCRPFSDEELRNNAPQVVTCNDYNREVLVSQSIAGKISDKVFTFDKVFGPSAHQKDLYEQAVIPIVNEVLEGFNCTIFAYGQTGTGKTYTMEGECKRSKNGPNGELPQEAGVIPRAVKQIFDTLEGQNAEYSVKVTFLELYNEEITDLLAPEELYRLHVEDKQRKQLPLMEDGKGGVLVRGLEEEIVTSASEIFTLLERGSAKRRTAETLLNKQSSRSHSLFSITIHIKESTPEGEELIKCGKLNLVDLAGSENISRSGARDGRAREAGEINKSLLTLGRVISALVEHLGHIPYRDSKLTRLLRDSLGGRTKTCIIATVSPAVHCVEETLSTLDYAHRAKNIRNKPEVNQKVMKSTLIKDLYGEIDRLKADVYAAREKHGIYLPKERYYQEESERKAMGDQIEQMGVMLETQRKNFEELRAKYDCQVNECFDLSCKLGSTQKKLIETNNMLGNSEEQLKSCNYALKEKEYILSEQRKSENALAHQASILRSDLEKSLQDNASLFSKISRKDKLNASNRLVVDNFKVDLAKQVDSICNILGESMSQQNDHLLCITENCHDFVDTHDKAVSGLKKKVESSRVLFLSHIKTLQNTLRLYKTSSDAGLQDISSVLFSNASTIQDFLAAQALETNSIFDDLQSILSVHQGEMTSFAGDLRQRFEASIEGTKDISEYIDGFLHKLLEESGSLGRYATEADLVQMGSITNFQKAYEEQSKSDEEKLIAGMCELISSHFRHEKEMMGERCDGIRKTLSSNKACLEDHVSSMNGITSDAKRKWRDFSRDAEIQSNDALEFLSVKHCRMESVSQDCKSKAENARIHCMRTQECLGEMETKETSSLNCLVRDGLENNQRLDGEVSGGGIAAEQDVAKSCEDIIGHCDSLSEGERRCISGICEIVQVHGKNLLMARDDQCGEAECLKQMSEETFDHRYMDDEATGATPQRRDTVVPSEGAIESLRTMPMDKLVEEFRENYPNPNPNPPSGKEQNKLVPPRNPLTHLN